MGKIYQKDIYLFLLDIYYSVLAGDDMTERKLGNIIL